MNVDRLQISDAAERLGVSVDTIRRWEKKSLIKSRRNELGHREFAVSEIERLMRKIAGEPSEHTYEVLRNEETELTAIDLFAGGGGTALGLENAGFRHLAVNEKDKWAAETLRKNRPEWNVIEGDVHNVSLREFSGHVDLVEGGFPCQAFSYAGNKLGFADTRGTLFHEFARIVSEVKPRVAMGENVRGLMTHDGGRTLKTMVKMLQDLGYKVAYKLLRAQYLDVAQKRERLIILAVREDLDIPILFPKERDYTFSLREVIGDVPAGPGMKYNSWKFEVMEQIPEGGNWRNLDDDEQRRYMKASYFLGGGKTGMARRLSWDEPSLTLTCNPAQKQTERCHPEETRPLNVREYSRIQSFPDDWVFAGSISQQYKQIGNAVPVNLSYHVGRGIVHMLSGGKSEQFEEVMPVPPIGSVDTV
ncbi:DNA (cytosine-5-)-methyltransferase [Corynebacterium dentalis]|uniref:DNA (cytosine-5-)-methyltransferase n=1 Tax=Corynebacterium dentalis TaxID=2014528 RepID=UPI00289DF755|nr:DNA (cytosine-5-)-methyltransferase [Corynebacterium dentalis]